MNLSCAYMGYSYHDDRSVQLMVIAVILLTLSLPTALVNASIIVAIFRKKELRTPTYYIIGNLALSDFLSGCSAYIFYSLVCIQFSLGIDACPVASIGTPWSYILGITTYSTIMLQTVERYVAVFHPFWYHNNFTTKLALLGNLTTWVLASMLVTVWITTKNNRLFNGFLGSVCFVFFIVNVICYMRVFREVRKIEKDMLAQQVLSSEERKKIRSNSKVAKATAIILLSFIVCFTPLLLLEFYIAFHEETSKFADDALYWVWLLALSNSLVNPAVACRQLKVLKAAVLDNFKSCRGQGNVSPYECSAAQTSKTSRTDMNFQLTCRGSVVADSCSKNRGEQL